MKHAGRARERVGVGGRPAWAAGGVGGRWTEVGGQHGDSASSAVRARVRVRARQVGSTAHLAALGGGLCSRARLLRTPCSGVRWGAWLSGSASGLPQGNGALPPREERCFDQKSHVLNQGFALRPALRPPLLHCGPAPAPALPCGHAHQPSPAHRQQSMRSMSIGSPCDLRHARRVASVVCASNEGQQRAGAGRTTRTAPGSLRGRGGVGTRAGAREHEGAGGTGARGHGCKGFRLRARQARSTTCNGP
jgi:hypothetical protein